jgi:hypothetical protein
MKENNKPKMTFSKKRAGYLRKVPALVYFV